MSWGESGNVRWVEASQATRGELRWVRQDEVRWGEVSQARRGDVSQARWGEVKWVRRGGVRWRLLLVHDREKRQGYGQEHRQCYQAACYWYMAERRGRGTARNTDSASRPPATGTWQIVAACYWYMADSGCLLLVHGRWWADLPVVAKREHWRMCAEIVDRSHWAWMPLYIG